MSENIRELIPLMVDAVGGWVHHILIWLADNRTIDSDTALAVALGSVAVILLLALMLWGVRGKGAEPMPVGLPETVAEQPLQTTTKRRKKTKTAVKQVVKAKPLVAHTTPQAVPEAPPIPVSQAPIESLDPSDREAENLAAPDTPPANIQSITLAGIESEMLALKELYAGGHITAEVYVAETRILYKKAQDISTK